MFYKQDKSVDSFRVDGLTSIVAVSPLMAMQGEVPLTEVVIRTQASVITFRTPTAQLDLFAQGAKDKVARLQSSNAALEQALDAKCSELKGWQTDHRRLEMAIAGHQLQEMELNRKVAELRQRLVFEQRERVIEDKKSSELERKLRASEASRSSLGAHTQSQALRAVQDELAAKDKKIKELEARGYGAWSGACQEKLAVNQAIRASQAIIIKNQRLAETKLREELAMARETGCQRQLAIAAERNSVQRLQTQVSQMHKEAKKWKDQAIDWCDQRDEALVKVARLEGQLKGTQGNHSAIAYSSWAPSYTVSSQPVRQDAVDACSTACAIVNEKPVATIGPQCGGRPMSTYDVPPYQNAMLFMFGKWLKGFKSRDGKFYAACREGHRSNLTDDEANQPLAWKPMLPKDGQPMETCPPTDIHKDKFVMLYMGDEWHIGGRNYTDSGVLYCTRTNGKGKDMKWDREHQPTAWKPIS